MRLAIRESEVVRLVQSMRPLLMDQRRIHNVTVKGVADFVTQADVSVQHSLYEALSKRWPGIGLLAEEEGAQPADRSKPLWILDPIDGTTNLIHDYKESCISLALWDGQQVILGVVYNPFMGETFSASKGQGARCNGRAIHVSRRPDLAHSLALFGTTPYEKNRADEVFEQAKQVFLHTEDLRRGGSAAWDLCRIACGRAELYFERNLKPWDYAAGLLLVQEAGGAVTRMDGSKLPVTENSDVLASNRMVHREAIFIL